MTYSTIFAIWIWWFLWAISRAYISQLVNIIFPSNFPFWTLTVNVIWSFLIWILFWIFFYYTVDIHIKSLIVTWFLWALTTFSTFALESFFLLDEWKFWKMLLNIFANVFLTIVFVAIWYYLSKYLIQMIFIKS